MTGLISPPTDPQREPGEQGEQREAAGADAAGPADTVSDASTARVDQPVPAPRDSAGEIPPPAARDAVDTVLVDGADQPTAAPDEADSPPAMPEQAEQPEPATDQAPEDVLASLQSQAQALSVASLCNEIGNKLGSVSVEDCLAQPLAFGGAYTVQSRPMVVRDFLPADEDVKNTRIFIMGGIHGDEYSSISIMFKWMELLDKSHNRDFHWRFAPTVNPDGLLDGQAVRQNANGVDLNRNFPSMDWKDLAQDYWTNTTNKNPRRFPGSGPASEPEVQWVVDQIDDFKPDVIVSVHAPYHLLDYDGPPEAPEQIGELHLHLLGVYPGSLGNYAGINLGIPVVTMELPSAGIMPSDEQIVSMWKDLLDWLYEHHQS